MTRLASVQMASGPNLSANLVEATRLITKAVQQGAKLVVLPENFALMGASEHDKVKIREQPGSGAIQDFLCKQAARHGIWLVGGTVPLACAPPEKVYAACLVFDPSGTQVARYDKIHLFDVTLNDEREESYTESDTIEPGHDSVVVETPFAKVGLAVCYDLRFPELFRCLMAGGAEIIALPSAFTAVTGKAHWETLVRARAIENLCYLVAANQGGLHVGGRETHGDSMIVDPWGLVVSRLPRGAGVILSDYDPERLHSLRRSFPVAKHRRFDCVRS